jgi:hypothetical protein
MKANCLFFLLGFILLFFLLSGCEKNIEQVQPLIPDPNPMVSLWPLPNNHPLPGDSVKIRIACYNTDSIRINGDLMRSAFFYTGPVFFIQKYFVEAFGNGIVVTDSILIIPQYPDAKTF